MINKCNSSENLMGAKTKEEHKTFRIYKAYKIGLNNFYHRNKSKYAIVEKFFIFHLNFKCYSVECSSNLVTLFEQ
jgi:hypothetical protein